MRGLFLFFFSLFFFPLQAAALEVDLGTDDVPEILEASSPDSEPRVFVRRLDGSLVGSFLAYDIGMRDGVTLAACDLTGDGVVEIITGTQFGGGPHVRVFTNFGVPTGVQFMAYDPAFIGGVSVACGDTDGNGTNEIITGAGPSGGPHVKIFSGNGQFVREFFSGDAHDTRGVRVWFANNQLSTCG